MHTVVKKFQWTRKGNRFLFKLFVFLSTRRSTDFYVESEIYVLNLASLQLSASKPCCGTQLDQKNHLVL